MLKQNCVWLAWLLFQLSFPHTAILITGTRYSEASLIYPLHLTNHFNIFNYHTHAHKRCNIMRASLFGNPAVHHRSCNSNKVTRYSPGHSGNDPTVPNTSLWFFKGWIHSRQGNKVKVCLVVYFGLCWWWLWLTVSTSCLCYLALCCCLFFSIYSWSPYIAMFYMPCVCQLALCYYQDIVILTYFIYTHGH